MSETKSERVVIGMSEGEARRAFARMRQLGEEIQAALTRGDWRIVFQASDLLPFALTRCEEAQAALPADEVARLSGETGQLLTQCEAAIAEAMRSTSREIGRVRQHRRLLASARSKRLSATAPTSSRTRATAA